MKKIKKSLAIILTIIMAFSSLPVAGLTAFANEADELIFIGGEMIDPIVPDGYYFTGKTNTDEYGVTIYQIDTIDSTVVLPIDLWVYADGRNAQNPDVLPAYPDKNSDGEPDVMVDIEDLPEAYDSRDYGYITPVENQIGGSCWAHTAIACVEANYIKQGFAETVDLSEYHTVWYSKNGYFKDNSDSLNDGYEIKNEADILGTGGNTIDVSNAMLNFAGGVLESTFPLKSSSEAGLLTEMKETFAFDGKYISDVVLDSIKSVDYYYWKNIPGTLSFEHDKDSPRIEYVKQAVMDYGAAFISYNSDESYYVNARTSATPTAYYNPNNISTNHAVTIVGWDDNFSRENFGTAKPNNDGAWLIKNSWGTNWGDDGYFWLSYEDKTIYGTVSVFDVADKEDFDEVYMYDGLSYSIAPYTSSGVMSAANVFVAESDIYLTKVSYGGTLDTAYTLKIYTNLPDNCTSPIDGILAYTQTGNTDGKRYIDIEGEVNISKGVKYSVILEMNKVFFEGSDVEKTEEYYRYNANPGESFYKSSAYGSWTDTTRSVNIGGTAYILNNSCIRAIAKYPMDEGDYKVTFKDGIKYNEVVISDGSVVTLPQRLGHTYVFTYNGEPFTGDNITHDITVETHCYLTVGEPSATSDCVIEYRCIYCGEEVKEAVGAHNLVSTVIPATSKNIGYTEYSCLACGEGYYGDYTLLDGSVGGETDGYWWQYADGCLSIMGDGKLPDYASADDQPWYSYRNSITEVNVKGKITRLGSYFFARLSKMKTITLPDTVEEIGERCFYSTSELEKFDCPENLLTIEHHGFYYSGITEFNNNKVLNFIGEEAFMQCTRLTEVTIPASAKNIGKFPYRNCHKLKKIIIEEGITQFESLIWETTPIEELVIPSTVTSMSLINFNYCAKYTVAEDNPVYCDVDGIVFSKDMKTLVSYPPSKKALYYKIPSHVTALSQGAFSHSTTLKYLDMSECKVTSIASQRFNQSRSLINVILPKSITKIDNNAFYLTSIKNIYVPSYIKTIGASAFTTGGYSSYIIPNFYTDSEDAAIKTWADSKGYSCTVLHTEHSFDTVMADMSKEPDCKNDGTSLSACVCGDFEYKTVASTGEHNFVKGKTISATCTEDGYTNYTCSSCGTTEARDIVTAPGHDYTDWNETEAPTCLESGQESRLCLSCGYTDINEIPALGHSYSKKVTAPTCTTKGYTTYKCACGDKYTADEVDALGHDYGDWNEEIAPTCLENGQESRVCSKCDDIEVREIPATGHSYNKEVIKPTCTVEGYTEYKCVCGFSYTTDKVAALGHTYEEWIEIKAPTCLVKGEESSICEVCGNPETREVAATGHSYNKTVTAPTCTTEGYTTFKCACGDSYTTDKVSATGHSYSDWYESEAPGCLTVGEESRLCSVCGDKETRELPATGHKHNKTVTAPTCTTEGYTTYKCACGDTYTADKVSATGHSYSSEITKTPTCTETGTEKFTCANCGDNYTETIPADDHSYVYVDEKAPTCTEPGYEAYEYCEKCSYTTFKALVATGHTYSATVTTPTCTDKGYTTYKCACGDTYTADEVPASGHDYSDWTQIKAPTCSVKGEESRVCTACGNTETRDVATTAHSYDKTVTASTCTDKGYTTYKCACGDTYTADEVPALGHAYGNWTQIKAPTCSIKGEESRVCTVCGNTETREVVTTAHSYDKTVTAPTCTDKGYTTYKCACGDTYTADEVPALGHAYGNWIQTKAPTCSVKGEESRACTVCGDIETRDVATIAHTYSSEVTVPTCTTKGYTTYKCACGYSYTANEVAAYGHSDTNADGACDRCGNSVDCSCNCHKSGFMGFIWKIVLFFNKLFKTNKTCACGASHY